MQLISKKTTNLIIELTTDLIVMFLWLITFLPLIIIVMIYFILLGLAL